jgi:PIN domain nuclease of toxin-antitoxin system
LRVLLDTHVWVSWLLDDGHLSANERVELGRLAAARETALAAISLWEVQVLHAKRRLTLDRPFALWLRDAVAPGVAEVLPLDLEVVLALDALPPSFHGDPADRLIVATARAHAMPLATHDARIRQSRIASLWKP